MPRKHPKPFLFTVSSVHDASAAACVSTDTISRWLAKGLVDRRSTGKRKYEYDLVQIVRQSVVEECERKHRTETRHLQRELEATKAKLDKVQSESAEQLTEMEKAKLLKVQNEARCKHLDYLARKAELMPRLHIQKIFSASASHYRRAGETLRRHHGEDAQQILLDAIEAVDHELETLFESQENTTSDVDQPATPIQLSEE